MDRRPIQGGPNRALALAAALIARAASPASALEGTPAPPGKETTIPGYALWIPDGVAFVRGVIAVSNHEAGADIYRDVQTYGSMRGKPLGYRDLARRYGLALFLFKRFATNGYEASNQRLIIDALAELAVRSGHPEIATAGLIPTGLSAGGFYAGWLAQYDPARVIAFFPIAGAPQGLAAVARMTKVPSLYINQGRDRIYPGSGVHVQPVALAGRRAGALWGGHITAPDVEHHNIYTTFGDSTASPLRTNFLELLRDAIDSCVALLLPQQRLAHERERLAAMERDATAEVARLEQMGQAVAAAVSAAAMSGEDSPTARCAAVLARTAEELVRTEVNTVRAGVGAQAATVEAQAEREKAACLDGLASLLLKHDLPGTTYAMAVVAVGGARYAARARATTTFELVATFDLEIPPSHLLGQLLRVERLAERLEVQAPEAAGWLHKEVRMKPQRLDRHHVTELSIGAGESVLKLRAAPDGTGGGYDLLFRDDPGQVRLAHVTDKGEVIGTPIDVGEADAEKLDHLYEELKNATLDLLAHRKALREAALDGEPLDTVDRPAALVDRLISALAPTVKELAARSLSPGELVLKRLLGDDRREEVFLSRADLLRKIEALSPALRGKFEPLGLAEPPSPPRPARLAPPLPLHALAAEPAAEGPAPPAPPRTP